ncbi:MAG: ferrous iron transport protein B [Treponemataceae bacterium]|nr:MAG: ferrous iron transport protein B [Treponemataceae bacterium]
MKTIRIALAGNPNAGKTTLFNALTGAHHKVGNYPGVTVEKREGEVQRGKTTYRFIDLPGIYSLTAYSIDEVVARDFILDEKPDVIIDVLDSTNLERNMYLCLQFQELGIPVIGALNMSDEAAAKGIRIDDALLSKTLGLPLVKTVGSKSTGIDALFCAIDDATDDAAIAKSDASDSAQKRITYGTEVEEKIAAIEKMLDSDAAFAQKYPVRFLAVKLLEKDADAHKRLEEHSDVSSINAAVRKATAWLDAHFARDSQVVISEQRYGYIRGAVKESVVIETQSDFSLTEKIDSVIMNRFLSLPIFLLILWGVFKITFALGEYPMGWLETAFGFLSDAVTNVLGDTLLQSLIVDGIIAGVGGVFSFIPQVVILFVLLSILEDTGYMSRAAFATDKILHAFGLHGQSIFPLMLGFGCAVPAVMASRTLKNPKDRILTILVTPFITCGAKLPVHILLAGTFFPGNAANMLMLIYLLGVIFALVIAKLHKSTILRGEPTPFVMELPPYRAPTALGIWWHVWEKTSQYVKKAGTIILACAVVVWAITTFPQYPSGEGDMTDATEVQATQAALEYSYAGRAGKAIEAVFKPLGFNWRLAVATITGFPAKEVVVSTLGILYKVGTEEDEESEGLREAFASDPTMSPFVAFIFMLFTMIIPPCFAALATIKAEIGWKWLAFEFVFLLALGWLVCFAVFQLGALGGLA